MKHVLHGVTQSFSKAPNTGGKGFCEWSHVFSYSSAKVRYKKSHLAKLKEPWDFKSHIEYKRHTKWMDFLKVIWICGSNFCL